MADRARIELEQVVPLTETAVPLFWLHETDPDGFAGEVRSHDGVNSLVALETTTGRTLYAFDWDRSRDTLLSTIEDLEGYLLNASGEATRWTFHVRFADHDTLSTFGEVCRDEGIRLELERVYNPRVPDATDAYGLTEIQYETLSLAVRKGYYDVPREVSTKELGEALGVSDQAVTERLRRAIVTLVTNTLLSPDSS